MEVALPGWPTGPCKAGAECKPKAYGGQGRHSNHGIYLKKVEDTARTGVDGFLQVEDLFYNVPTRRRAFRSSSEEYAKILDVVGRYAVHRTGVAFSCRKHGDSGVSIATSANSSTLDRVRQIHGSTVASELVSFEIDDRKWGCKASGWASNANYHTKRTTILIFINHRSVESTAIRKAIEQTYSAFLPKGGHPFVYLDLEIEPQRLDVNIHPTKREVNFLNEDEIVESICEAIRAKLATVDSSRAFTTQTLLPGVRSGDAAVGDGDPSTAPDQDGRSTARTPSSTKRPYENNLVRTDAKMRKITSMLPPSTAQPSTDITRDDHPSGEGGDSKYQPSGREPVHIRLASVKNLRAAVRESMHNDLTEVFASHTYVGLVDERRRIAAIQSGVKLFLVDYGMICSEFFYQVGLTDFGKFGVINLESSPKLSDLIGLAAATERDEHYLRRSSAKPATGQSESQTASAGKDDNDDHHEIDVNRITEMVTNHLIERREMLDEYFSLSISDDGCLLSIPMLLKGYTPSLAKLPRFLLRLGPYVDWTSEETCFHTFLRELALFYTPEQLPPLSPPRNTLTPDTSQKKDDDTQSSPPHEPHSNGTNTDPSAQDTDLPHLPTSQSQHPQEQEPTLQTDVDDSPTDKREEESISRRREQLARMSEHVLFPALRSRLVATNDLVRGVVEVADLKGLYRVFERC